MVVDSRVGPLDRTLGFLFGAARGVLICIVAAVFANFLLAPKLPDMVADAKSFPPLLSAGNWLIDKLPPNIEAQVQDFLHKPQATDETNGPNDQAPGASSAPPDAASTAPSSNVGA